MPDTENSFGNGISIVDIVLWPAKSFMSTRDFISKIPSAGLTITIIGQILDGLGLSPAIASAVSILGVAAVFTEVGLKVILMSREPLKELGLKSRATAFFIYFVAGIAYFTFNGPGSLQAPVVTVTQFVLGLGVTYLAGTVFMIAWKTLEEEDANISYIILASMSLTIGIITLGFWTIDTLLELSNNPVIKQTLFNKPENVSSEAAIVSTNPSG